MSPTPSRILLERRYRFSAAHLYRRAEWSEDENRRRFGKCANLPGHGHNYRLYVTVAGKVDPATGFLVDLGELDRTVGELVVERLDHQHLNEVVERFRRDQIPSSENLIIWIHEKLAGGLPAGVELVRLRLEEDDDLAAELIP